MKMRKMRIYIKNAQNAQSKMIPAIQNAYFAYPYKKGDHHFYDPSPWSVMAIWSIRNEPQPWFLERFGRSLRVTDWYLRNANFGAILVLVTQCHTITAWYSTGNKARKYSMMESNQNRINAKKSLYLRGISGKMSIFAADNERRAVPEALRVPIDTPLRVG